MLSSRRVPRAAAATVTNTTGQVDQVAWVADGNIPSSHASAAATPVATTHATLLNPGQDSTQNHGLSGAQGCTLNDPSGHEDVNLGTIRHSVLPRKRTERWDTEPGKLPEGDQGATQHFHNTRGIHRHGERRYWW